MARIFLFTFGHKRVPSRWAAVQFSPTSILPKREINISKELVLNPGLLVPRGTALTTRPWVLRQLTVVLEVTIGKNFKLSASEMRKIWIFATAVCFPSG